MTHIEQLGRFIKGMALGALVAGAISTQARDAVEITGTYVPAGGGAPVTLSPRGGDSIPDLVENLVNADEEFADLETARAVNASLRYLDVADAIAMSINETAPGSGLYTATLRVAGGDTRMFGGAGVPRQQLEDEIEDYLEDNGSDDLTRLMKFISKNSALAVMSGTPHSSAAMIAQSAFDQYGFQHVRTNAEREGDMGRYELGLLAEAGFFESRGLRGQTYSLTLPFSIFERERWAVRLQIPLNYTTVEDADVFRFGPSIGVPIHIIGGSTSTEPGWRWQVTPSGGAHATASADLVAGGLLGHASLSSALGYDLGPDCHNLLISMGNQLTLVESIELNISDFTLDPDLSEQILKNGIKASLPFGQSWFADVYFVDTRFLSGDGYMDGYETVGGAIGFRRARGGIVRLGLYGNFGKNYSSANVQVGATWRF